MPLTSRLIAFWTCTASEYRAMAAIIGVGTQSRYRLAQEREFHKYRIPSIN